ncbi:hypothetical protein FKW77_005264 [Venturia effusa]|uniref:gamma-glutamylcyclotransferase n=1 Tax=Venturia effusa TaxID=50376 RepID=A0A517KWC9_9PEZI|nr:hypothetical protein FKW77_005264 [Venturia effusa]
MSRKENAIIQKVKRSTSVNMAQEKPPSIDSLLPPETIKREFSEQRASISVCMLRKAFQLRSSKNEISSACRKPTLPHPSSERLQTSRNDYDTITACDHSDAKEKHKTVLYLAYGSNLCYQTFQGTRGIKPISQMNVVVPSLRMTFDLPGIAYAEPCFANSAIRDPTKPPPKSDYNKDQWKKGMVGVVYEVTISDYAHIIATEGGGSSYQDILVDCHPLEDGVDIVPEIPITPAFKAHTLFAPALPPSAPSKDLGASARFQRPDPAYAQASARYLKLITDGADEHGMPKEYKDYLHGLQPYTITSQKQLLGQFIFLSIYMPFILLIFAIGRMVQDKKGRSPKWYTELLQGFFVSTWRTYDGFFKPLFGDGERTQERRKHKHKHPRKGMGDEEEAMETQELSPEYSIL